MFRQVNLKEIIADIKKASQGGYSKKKKGPGERSELSHYSLEDDFFQGSESLAQNYKKEQITKILVKSPIKIKGLGLEETPFWNVKSIE